MASQGVDGGEVVLDGDESHHAVSVLRVAVGSDIRVTDGGGHIADCAVQAINEGRVVARVLAVETVPKSFPELVVYTGAAKGSKVDDVIERLTELGAAEVRVYSSSRSVVHWDANKRKRLTERWESISRSAAKVSRSAFVTKTGPPLSWAELLEAMGAEPQTIVLWEEATARLRTALGDLAERIALVIGPEGGLSRVEAEQLAGTGAKLVSLGPRILRTQNAPVVATSALLFHLGTIG